MSLVVGSGITVESGVTIASDNLLLSLDAATYSNTTTGTQQNVSGTSDNIGFFPYGWPAYSAIQPGWTCVQTGAVVTVVDGVSFTITTVGTPFTSGDSYTFTSAVSWIDSVSNRTFILNNGVTYSSSNGGTLLFDTASNQYAQCASSLPDLPTWSVIVWHYYTNTNSGSSPCIITEVYPGTTGKINYVLGSAVTTGLQAAYFAPGWVFTDPTYNLTPDTWNQIVGTYDGNIISLYVNNSLVAASSNNNLAGSSNGGINLMRRWDSADFWGGYLSIVKVYAGSIGAGGVADDWAANAARFGL